MKQIPAALVSHLGQEATTTCLLMRVRTKDGTLLGFTNLDADVTYDPATVDPDSTGDDWGSLVHKADNGFMPERLQTTADLSVDNTDLQGWVTDTGITEAQIRAGLFDYADVRVYRVNYLDLTMGHEVYAVGTLGETQFSENGWRVEFRSLTQQLKQTIADLYSLTCTAPFGSARCGKTFAWTAGEITAVDTDEPDRIITTDLAAADDFYRLGVVRVTSGQNDGWEGEVESHESGVLTFALPAPYPFAADDTFEAREDCSKEWDDDDHGCLHHWVSDRVSHFRGHPHVPVDGSPLVPNAEIRRSSGGGGGK